MACRVPPVGRERRERRPQLRQKRRELGLARDWEAELGTQYLSSGRGAAPGSFAGRCRAMDRERCAPRAQKLCRDPKARCSPRITSTQMNDKAAPATACGNNVASASTRSALWLRSGEIIPWPRAQLQSVLLHCYLDLVISALIRPSRDIAQRILRMQFAPNFIDGLLQRPLFER